MQQMQCTARVCEPTNERAACTGNMCSGCISFMWVRYCSFSLQTGRQAGRYIQYTHTLQCKTYEAARKMHRSRPAGCMCAVAGAHNAPFFLRLTYVRFMRRMQPLLNRPRCEREGWGTRTGAGTLDVGNNRPGQRASPSFCAPQKRVGVREL